MLTNGKSKGASEDTVSYSTKLFLLNNKEAKDHNNTVILRSNFHNKVILINV